MLSNLFRNVVELSPKMSITVWKYFYELTALLFNKKAAWKFMNYGYADHNEDTGDYDTLCGNLYHHLAKQANIDKRNHVLEVGSGRGGGCELILNYHPATVTGLDFSANAVQFCRKNYPDKRLKFVTGNAENLPFEDDSFDVIINVESSHCYGNRMNFFKEVTRTLKPSGYFLYADFMGRVHYQKRPIQLQNCGLNVLSEQDITPQVLKSMELSLPYKTDLIRKMVLKPFRKSIADFAGLPGSTIYNKFASGESVYFCMVCSKKD